MFHNQLQDTPPGRKHADCWEILLILLLKSGWGLKNGKTTDQIAIFFLVRERYSVCDLKGFQAHFFFIIIVV